MLARPLVLPPVSPITRSVFGMARGGAPRNAFSAAKLAIEQDAGNVSILVVGDSTGNETTEWPYLFGQWLATEHPTHSVSYRLWNDSGNTYDAAVSLGAGSGGNTIRLWNASVAGAHPMYLIGSKLAASITATNPNLVIWNHGHNLASAGTLSPSLARGGFLSATEQVRQALPGVPQAFFLQNPRRDDSQMAVVFEEMRDVAGDYGDVRLLDVYSRFLAAGKPAGWYADNVHPNSTGQAEFLAVIEATWRAARVAAYTAADAFLETVGTNILTASNFGDGAAYAGGVPTGWSALASATVAVDAAIFDAGRSQSLKITGTTGGSGMFLQTTNIDALKGNKATLAVRQYVPPGSASSVGRIGLLYNNGTNTFITSPTQGDIATGGFRWNIISGVEIPSNAVHVRAYLYCDTAANVSSAAYYDRAILVPGDVPRDLM